MTIIDSREGAVRRFGFVAILWWIAFLGATFDAIQNNNWSVMRIIWVVVGLGLAVFFTYTWRKLKKGTL